jgi:hypothetical protein
MKVSPLANPEPMLAKIAKKMPRANKAYRIVNNFPACVNGNMCPYPIYTLWKEIELNPHLE